MNKHRAVCRYCWKAKYASMPSFHYPTDFPCHECGERKAERIVEVEESAIGEKTDLKTPDPGPHIQNGSILDPGPRSRGNPRPDPGPKLPADIEAFLESEAELSPSAWAAKEALYGRYRLFMVSRGWRPRAKIDFGRWLKKAGFGDSRPKLDGRRVWVWRGVRLKGEGGEAGEELFRGSERPLSPPPHPGVLEPVEEYKPNLPSRNLALYGPGRKAVCERCFKAKYEPFLGKAFMLLGDGAEGDCHDCGEQPASRLIQLPEVEPDGRIVLHNRNLAEILEEGA